MSSNPQAHLVLVTDIDDSAVGQLRRRKLRRRVWAKCHGGCADAPCRRAAHTSAQRLSNQLVPETHPLPQGYLQFESSIFFVNSFLIFAYHNIKTQPMRPCTSNQLMQRTSNQLTLKAHALQVKGCAGVCIGLRGMR